MRSFSEIQQKAGVFFQSRSAAFRLAGQLVIAGEFTYLFTGWVGLPQSVWAIFTAIIVIQSNVGGSLKAAMDRLTGTLAGGMIGFIAASAEIQFPHLRPYTLLIALAPAGLLAALNPSFRIAPVTAAIMVLSRYGVTPFAAAVDRVFEISVGSLIGVAVSMFVFPARAHKDLYAEVCESLFRMADVMVVRVGVFKAPVDLIAANELRMKAKSHLAAADKLAGEARQERSARLTDERDPTSLVLAGQRLYTDLLILNRTLERPHSDVALQLVSEPLTNAAGAFAASLRSLGDALRRGVQPADLEQPDRAIATIDEVLADIRQKRVLRTLPAEQVQDLYTLLFVFHQFRRDLGDMHDRVSEMVSSDQARRSGGEKSDT